MLTVLRIILGALAALGGIVGGAYALWTVGGLAALLTLLGGLSLSALVAPDLPCMRPDWDGDD